jgi:hypothetical protein
MRIDLYTAIHKTQRFHLFRLAQQLGRADASRPESWPPLCREVKVWLDLLEAHAQHEHDFIHPLFERCSDCATHLDAEHEALGRAMDELKQTLAAGHLDLLYARFVAFLGVYLVHIAKEEQLQASVLWTHCSDTELGDVFMRFRQSRSPDEARRDLQLMLPALSIDELTRIYSGIRQLAPSSAWEASLVMARRTLTSSEAQQLEARLAQHGSGES